MTNKYTIFFIGDKMNEPVRHGTIIKLSDEFLGIGVPLRFCTFTIDDNITDSISGRWTASDKGRVARMTWLLLNRGGQQGCLNFKQTCTVRLLESWHVINRKICLPGHCKIRSELNLRLLVSALVYALRQIFKSSLKSCVLFWIKLLQFAFYCWWVTHLLATCCLNFFFFFN